MQLCGNQTGQPSTELGLPDSHEDVAQPATRLRNRQRVIIATWVTIVYVVCKIWGIVVLR